MACDMAGYNRFSIFNIHGNYSAAKNPGENKSHKNNVGLFENLKFQTFCKYRRTGLRPNLHQAREAKYLVSLAARLGMEPKLVGLASDIA